MTSMPRFCASLVLVVAMAACSSAVVAPTVVTAPKFPDFILPVPPSPPDPHQAELVKQLNTGWQFLQAGDLPRAEREFQLTLKKSPEFFPSEAALGYVEMARSNYAPAIEHFDRVLQRRADYVPALVGRGQSLLASSKEPEALVDFEAAVKNDPTLTDIARRVDVLHARRAQETVAAARAAATGGRLDEAATAYEQAIAASPDSAFLFRDLADVEARQGKQDRALEHFRKAIELEPSDVQSRIRIGEMRETANDLEGAKAMYTEANNLEPSADLSKRLAAIEAREAYLRLPAEYRAIPETPSITRGDLASLIGIRLEPLLSSVPQRPIVITDTRSHWAEAWINASVAAGVMDAYDNHTFAPTDAIQRSDLAQVVSRVLKLIAARHPQLLKDWQSRQQKMSDVGVSNLNFADASLSVAAGILPLTPSGTFQLSRPVTGSEAIDAMDRLERLLSSEK